MSSDTPQSRTLHRALRALGSVAALAKALRVPAETLAGWLDGDAVPPDVYLMTLDIVASGQPPRWLH
jgi:hypothetical protein